MKPLPRLHCCWVEKRIKKERGRTAESTFFVFHVCLLYCKCYTLKVVLNFIVFVCRMIFFSASCASVSHNILCWYLSSIVSAVLPLLHYLCAVCVGGFGENM